MWTLATHQELQEAGLKRWWQLVEELYIADVHLYVNTYCIGCGSFIVENDSSCCIMMSTSEGTKYLK